MGFIPLPLGVVMIRVVGTAVRGHTQSHMAIIFLAYLCLVTFRVLASIVILGKACDLIDHHHELKKATVASSSPNKKKTDTSSTSKEPTNASAADNSIQNNDSMTSGTSTASTMISEDMAILEAKLQTIDGAGNCTTYSH